MAKPKKTTKKRAREFRCPICMSDSYHEALPAKEKDRHMAFECDGCSTRFGDPKKFSWNEKDHKDNIIMYLIYRGKR